MPVESHALDAHGLVGWPIHKQTEIPATLCVTGTIADEISSFQPGQKMLESPSPIQILHTADHGEHGDDRPLAKGSV
jgi:hypothetical protein